MAVFTANCAFDAQMGFGLEGASPSAMAVLLAILTVIVVDALDLQVEAIQEFLELFVFLPVQYF